MATENPYSPERLADRMEIQDAMYKWCRSIDRLDFDGIRASFHADAYDNHGPYAGNVDGLVEWVRERHKSVAFSSHQISNILIEFAGKDSALVETYIRTIQRYPAEGKAALAQIATGQSADSGTGFDLMTSARYVDRFERRNGRWLVARRNVIHDWKRVMEVTEVAKPSPPGWVVGCRNQDDFVFAERRAMGI